MLSEFKLKILFETSPPTLQLKIMVTSRIVFPLLVEKLIQCSMPRSMKGKHKLRTESNFHCTSNHLEGSIHDVAAASHIEEFSLMKRNEKISHLPQRT